ncbi:MAG: protoheme IX farnesyltransferase [Chloroflexi bacterium]|nr:protoheme IX farnesyltransferase [Chloroflexota bacterium]|tara:strand:+ start:28808 stop:29671 length:864 start_codon:yes stop_codon:yes gene_type:complete
MIDIIKDYITLTKPTIMLLLLITAAGGMVMAAEGAPGWNIIAAVLIGGAFASGGASALNHYLERDSDLLMKRTANRPVSSRRIPIRNACIFGISLTICSFAIIWIGSNLFAASLAMLGSVLYLLLYTKLLKRSTIQNIVIGGAAGAMPPLVGWAAVTGNLTLSAYYLFLIIFFWTPPHFWALSLLIKKDYAEANIPMLPVIYGEAVTRKSILLYTIVLVTITSLFTMASEQLGLFYLIGSGLLGILFLVSAIRLVISKTHRAILETYIYSMAYLAILFSIIMIESTT